MKANQILNGFSEALMQDERILSVSEKELLVNLLQNAGSASAGNPEIQTAVMAAIHRAVGETVAQRAFGLLGGSIVEQILATTSPVRTYEPATLGSRPPVQPPSQGPGPPSAPLRDVPVAPGPPSAPTRDVPAPPGPPTAPRRDVPVGPGPPSAPLRDVPVGPGPPSAPGPHGFQPFTVDAHLHGEEHRPDRSGGVEVLEAPENLRAQSVVLDEFLAPQEFDELMRYTLEHESEFQVSEVVVPSGDAVDYNHRRSHVLQDLGQHHNAILERIRGVLSPVLQQLGMEEFPVRQVEMQITSSNDGDFFRMHSDDGQGPIASRKLTFVYFFHREPCAFQGGELHLHDGVREGDRYVSAGSCQTIVPQQNQIVFFPSSLPHEITPVKCPSRAFTDSRFTVNGWLRQ
jgi:Rps23 Pro-64 3,4-dihydroxylase Tpa1-like proline 4-hydroxylase